MGEQGVMDTTSHCALRQGKTISFHGLFLPIFIPSNLWTDSRSIREMGGAEESQFGMAVNRRKWAGSKKGQMERIHADDHFLEMQARAREKQGWHSGRTESVTAWHPACERRCQEWLYFLGGHRSRRWCVVTAKPLTAGQGIWIVLGVMILRVGCTRKTTAG